MEISIIIPVYNKLPHLERTFNSVLNQTVSEFEIIVVDDGSIDGSWEYLASLKDERVKLFRREQPGKGGYAARNLGISEAKGTWVCFLDADDEWDSNYIEQLIMVKERFPLCEVIAFGWKDSEEPKDVKHYGDDIFVLEFGLEDFMKNQKLMWTGAVSFSKELLMRVGMFPAHRNVLNGGDLDTWIRALYNSRQSVYSSQVLAIYYTDTVNRVTDFARNPSYDFCSYETLQQIKQYHISAPLKEAIDSYINACVYNIQMRQIRNGHPISFTFLQKMSFTSYSTLRFIKIILTRLKYLIKK